jgi:hypothetical protein
MRKGLNEFSISELVQRRQLQELLHGQLTALRQSLDAREYDSAVYHNINGVRVMNVLISKELAIEDEIEMLEALRENVGGILRLQHRLQ